jgi:hypothetical protein
MKFGVAALLLVGAGCSSAETDLFPNQDGGLADGAPAVDGAIPSSDKDAGGTQSCAVGRKSCSGTCVSTDDSRTGCGAPSCAPCVIAHGSAKCASGGCAVAECESGRADCDGNPSDGCEVDVTSDPKHCGACTTACAPEQVCGPNGCAATCPGNLSACSGSCVDLNTNPDNCGSCARQCSAPANGVATCSAKTCGFRCVEGYHACGSDCVAESVTSCGTGCAVCPQPANSKPTCISGSCDFTCDSGYVRCGGGTACCLIVRDAGTDGGPCDATNTCSTSVPMGSVRGDIASDVVSTTGTTSEFLRVTVAEGSNSLVDMKFTATLTSPPGMDFNLFVNVSPCGSGSYGQSTNPAGETDVVRAGWADSFGFDDTKTVLLEVRYASGGVCGPSWTLEIDGNE